MRYNHRLLLLSLLILSPLCKALLAEEHARYRIAPSMLVHLRHLESTINAASPETLMEHRKVAEVLQDDLGKLMASCSMKGEAHDALHNWLVPFMKTVQNYGAKQKPEELTAGLDKLRRAFKDFNTRFE